MHSKFSNNAATLRIAMALFVAILCGGCQSVHVHESVIAKFPGSDTDSQLNFWHELASRHLTSNDDAFHGLLLYLDSKDDSKDYAQRVETLKSRGMLPASFDEPADMAIKRGHLAVAVAQKFWKSAADGSCTFSAPRHAMPSKNWSISMFFRPAARNKHSAAANMLVYSERSKTISDRRQQTPLLIASSPWQKSRASMRRGIGPGSRRRDDAVLIEIRASLDNEEPGPMTQAATA